MKYLPLALGAVLVAPMMAADWRPITPEELKLTKPRIQADADAEAISWDVAIEDSIRGDELELAFITYVRIKIFTARGVTDHATVEIPLSGKRFATAIAGRTLKPDGKIIELEKSAIFDRDLVKTKGYKAKGKSFALPQVEPGDVIEYQYREVHQNASSNYLHLHFQRDMPVWRATYQLKPLDFAGDMGAPRMRSINLNLPPLHFERSKTRMGFVETSVENLPAFKVEPYMPPDEEVRSWMLIYYEQDRKLEPEKFWKAIGKADFDSNKNNTKVDGAVKKLAAELTAGLEAPEAKLEALEKFCRTSIKNLSWSASGITAEERAAFKRNLNPASTLKQKMGNGDDVRYLFASLAQALGMDARVALVPNRGARFFRPMYMTRAFLNDESVAVKVGENWRFFDPGTPNLALGNLRWQEEGLNALVTDAKDPVFVVTPSTPAAKSMKARVAKLKLLDDGTLEGRLRYEYTGHAAVAQRNGLDDQTENERTEEWKQALVERLSTAEVSDIKFENLADTSKPVVVSCKISVPGYATRTGKRLLLQPAFFERNITAAFQNAERVHDIYFQYAWTEDDQVEIELPIDWALDQPEAPAGFDIANFGSYKVQLATADANEKLVYHRTFTWGTTPGINGLLVAKAAYPQLKKVFEAVHELDNHMLTLKPKAQ